MTELHKRLAVSVIFIPLILAALYWRGIPLLVLFGLVSLLGMGEIIRMLGHRSIHIGWPWLAIAPAAYLGIALFPGYELAVLFCVVLFALIDAVFVWNADQSLLRAVFSIFGTLYTAFLPAMIIRLAREQLPPYLLLGLVALIWCADSAAYFIGTTWGKHRNLFPMSPNKSLEGIIAGMVVPFLIVIILYFTSLSVDPAVLLLTAFAAGVVGQVGDLAESMLKRWCGVKDSSRLIPGHGGILDRVDSILLAGSFLYFAMTILTKVR